MWDWLLPTISFGSNLVSSWMKGNAQEDYNDDQLRIQQDQYKLNEEQSITNFGLELEKWKQQNEYQDDYYQWAKDQADDAYSFKKGQYDSLQTLYAQKKNAINKTAQAQIDETLRQARENYKVHMYDATVAREDAFNSRFSWNEAYRNKMREDDMLLADQKSTYAGAGVVVGGGTPKEVARQTARLATENMISMRFEGKKAFDYAMDLEKRHQMLGQKTMREAVAAANTIEKIASYQSELAEFEADTIVEPVYKEPAPPNIVDLEPWENRQKEMQDNFNTRWGIDEEGGDS